MINLNRIKFNNWKRFAYEGEKEIVLAALSAITFLGNLVGEGRTETGVVQQAKLYYAFIPRYIRYSCGHFEFVEVTRELVAVDSQIYGWELNIADYTVERTEFSNGVYATVVNGRFALVEEKDTPCKDCIRKEYRPDESIQDMVFSHGLNAWRYTDPAGVEKRVLGLEQIKGEICTGLVDDDLGKIGCYVRGDVVLASRVDLGSHIDPDGRRSFNFFHGEKYLVKEKKDLHNKRSHVEVLLTNVKIQSVWVKAEAIGIYKDVVSDLKKKGYTVKVVA